VDFIVRRTDGSAYRLHPGSKPRNDATPQYYPRGLPWPPVASGGASEPAVASGGASEPPVASDGAPQAQTPPAFTWSEAQLIPQSDRMGKYQAWRLLDALRGQLLDALRAKATPGDSSMHFADLTDGTRFPWKLWLCNLGHLTQEILATGISTVHLRLDQAPTWISLTLTRADGTAVELSLAQHTRKDGTHSYHTEFSENCQ